MADAARAGLFASLRGLLASAVGLLQTRLELLATELQEEKVRLFSVLAYGFAAVLLLCFGAAVLIAFLTVLFWDSSRLLVLGLGTLFLLGGGAIALALAAAELRRGSRLFSASLAELRRDRADLESKE
ncbi:MAG TPA: phage holin family protein [Rhodocyclaceae bacterium]|nr:phage holin family protein [Rhodocyclaceae bacterium]